MKRLDSTLVELPKLEVVEVDGNVLLDQSHSDTLGLSNSTRSKAPKKACNFAIEAGKEKCFGAVGNQCMGGMPWILGLDRQNPKYYSNCTVQAFVTAGSRAHDTCCFRNPNGRACKGWSPLEDLPNRRKAVCSKEWDQAVNDSLYWRGSWMIFGPYYK
jgi:hypothetical protein